MESAPVDGTTAHPLVYEDTDEPDVILPARRSGTSSVTCSGACSSSACSGGGSGACSGGGAGSGTESSACCAELALSEVELRKLVVTQRAELASLHRAATTADEERAKLSRRAASAAAERDSYLQGMTTASQKLAAANELAADTAQRLERTSQAERKEDQALFNSNLRKWITEKKDLLDELELVAGQKDILTETLVQANVSLEGMQLLREEIAGWKRQQADAAENLQVQPEATGQRLLHPSSHHLPGTTARPLSLPCVAPSAARVCRAGRGTERAGPDAGRGLRRARAAALVEGRARGAGPRRRAAAGRAARDGGACRDGGGRRDRGRGAGAGRREAALGPFVGAGRDGGAVR